MRAAPIRTLFAATVLALSFAPDVRAEDFMGMAGAFGPYAMDREASGTSWQPEAVPMQGIMTMDGDWMTMVHGYLYQVRDHQGGPRGANEDFSESMFMVMAQRTRGQDTLGLRGMFSLDPLMGPAGYPLLLQTGETADRVNPLVDRQHPHDLFMELSASYSHAFAETDSLFVYAGLPGEPALGPPAFMHRASGVDNPEAPLSHHWLDSTHVTFGVLTAGLVLGQVKLEASVFHGREPDERRWNIDGGALDSYAARATWNPDEHWSLQASRGYLRSPEQLDPAVDQRRSTASAMYSGAVGDAQWDATLGWGQDDNRPGDKLDAWLAESELKFSGVHTWFARLERVQEDELLPSMVTVGKLSVGYIHDWPVAEHLSLGLGGLVSVYGLPATAQAAYGNPHSYMLFLRLKLL